MKGCREPAQFGLAARLELADNSQCRSSRFTINRKLIIALVLFFLLAPWLAHQSTAQTPISFGQNISSDISVSGEQDAYSFTADAGDVVLIRMSTDTMLDPKILLYDPEGNYLTDNSVEGPDTTEIITGPLSLPGTYGLIVSDGEDPESGDYGTETGGYWLYVQQVKNPLNAVPMDFGESFPASIASAREVDTFTFEAQAGDTILIWMFTDSGLDPAIFIYGPDGSYYNEQSDYGPGTMELVLPQLSMSGTYTLLAHDGMEPQSGDHGTETGPYWLFVQRTTNPGEAALIDFGKIGPGSISSSHEVDTYVFDALEGDRVWVRINTDPSLDPTDLDPAIYLYGGGDGSYVTENFKWEKSDPGPLDEWTTIPDTGTYVLMIKDWAYLDSGDYGQGTGNYWLHVDRVNHPAEAVQIPLGKTLMGSITTPYEMDIYRFDALKDDEVVIRMSTDSTFDPEMWLFNPNGDYITEHYRDSPGTWEQNVKLDANGRYTLMAVDWGDSVSGDPWAETGDYWLFVQRVNNPILSTQIAFGETLSAHMSNFFEVDTYQFDALAGDKVLIAMSTDTGLDPAFALYGPDGAYINEAETEGPDTVEIETEALVNTGNYTVLAWNGGSGKETGPYTLSLKLKAGDPGSLTVSPGDGINASGLVGGPFSPLSRAYTLENSGDLPIEWTLTKAEDWLDISSGSGTLEAGTSHTVTVSIKAEMLEDLQVGTYADTLIFTNTTEANRRFIRLVSVRVDPIEGILEVTPPDDVSFSGSPGGPFEASGVTQYALKNVGQKPMNWRASKTAFWLTLSADHGVLEPEETTDVTPALNEVAQALSKKVWTDTIIFTNQSNGYGNTSRNVTLSIGVSPSQITAEISQDNIILGEPLRVSGKITPEPCDAGAWVDVVLIPPSGPAVHQSVTANTQGEFNYSVACGDINLGGSWTIHTSWSGDRCRGEATSAPQTLEVIKADSRLTVDAGSRAVKLGEVVDISGKLTPDPDCGVNLMGRYVKLLIFGPDGRSDIQTVTTNDRFGHYVLQDYQGFNALGQWNVQALFLGDPDYEESHSEVITVQVLETAGYAVIMEGRVEDEPGLTAHMKTTSFVYEQFRQRGLLDDAEHDDIRYLTYDTAHPGYDGTPSKSAAQEAITEWARDKMNNRPANLYIVFLDHGLENRFFVYPDEISSSDMDLWLDTLQNDLFGQAAVQEIVVMLGFCRSGSFLNDIAGWNRIVIASAAADESSYKGPLDPADPSGVRDGEFFITEFFKGAALGKDVLSCFQEAAQKTEIFTSRGTGESNAPFGDDSRQHPLLDDNGDGIGENNPNGDPGYDGHLSRNLFIGVSSVTGNAPGDVQVTEVSPSQFLETGLTTASFWARVDPNERMRSLWLEVKRPGYDPGSGGSEQIEMDLPRHAFDAYDEGQNRYEWSTVPGFTEPGTYQIFFFARDDETGNESSIKQTVAYISKPKNNPPQTFDLLSPLDGSVGRTVLALDWSDTLDPDGDPLTYILEISRVSTFDTVVHRAERLSRSHYFVEEDAALKDLTTYYWRVIATDLYGASTPSNQVWHFKTDNTNEMMGWIKGLVYNSHTGQVISDALVNVGGIALNTTLNGYYLGVISPGTYQVEATATGYKPKGASGVVIPQGNIVTKDFGLELLSQLKGDIDSLGSVDLADTILALQILGGITPSAMVNKEADVNGDQKVGLEELIYILQDVAGLR